MSDSMAASIDGKRDDRSAAAAISDGADGSRGARGATRPAGPRPSASASSEDGPGDGRAPHRRAGPGRCARGRRSGRRDLDRAGRRHQVELDVDAVGRQRGRGARSPGPAGVVTGAGAPFLVRQRDDRHAVADVERPARHAALVAAAFDLEHGGADRVGLELGAAPGLDRVAHRSDQLGDHRRRDPPPLLEHPLAEGVAVGGGARPSLIGVLAQGPAHDRRQPGLEVGAVLVEAGQPGVTHHEQHVELVGGGEQAAPGQHLGQQHADREHVGPVVDRDLLDLLGRHVAVLALERARLALVRALGVARAGDAEVDQLDVATRRQQDVRRRDVAVDHAHRLAIVGGQVVGVLERVEHLVRDPHRQVRRQALLAVRQLAQQGEHVDAIDELHGDVQLLADLTQLVGLRDLRVDQPRGQLGLVDEHRLVQRLGRQVRQQALDDQPLGEAVLPRGRGHEQLGHASDGEALDQLVAPELDWELRHAGASSYHRSVVS
jgi:hypothetical protein